MNKYISGLRKLPWERVADIMLLKDVGKLGWGDGSIGKALALQTFGLESHPQNHVKSLWVWWHWLGIPSLGGWGKVNSWGSLAN